LLLPDAVSGRTPSAIRWGRFVVEPGQLVKVETLDEGRDDAE
jgi:hypothetical protein